MWENSILIFRLAAGDDVAACKSRFRKLKALLVFRGSFQSAELKPHFSRFSASSSRVGGLFVAAH